MKPLKAANDNSIDRTRKVWEQRAGRDLAIEDARQINENIAGFFALLVKWSRAEVPTPANDIGQSAGSTEGEARHER